jgi:hypothetical protein
MMRSLGGAPPRASQTNLKDNLRTQHFFLACGCHPERDMEIAIASETVAIKARAQAAGQGPWFDRSSGTGAFLLRAVHVAWDHLRVPMDEFQIASEALQLFRAPRLFLAFAHS